VAPAITDAVNGVIFMVARTEVTAEDDETSGVFDIEAVGAAAHKPD
jgi:hypothetical protein